VKATLEGKPKIGKKVKWRNEKGEAKTGVVCETTHINGKPIRVVVRGPRSSGIFILDVYEKL
jgi:hypothetical protein